MLSVIEAAPSRELVSLEAVKAELELVGSADDDVLGAMIRQASADIVRYTGRVFQVEAIREVFRIPELCRSAEPLLLQHRPVVELLTVEEDGLPVAPADYELEAELGLLHRLRAGHRSCWWAACVVVEYRAGYEAADLPEDLRRVCIDLVKWRYFSRSRDPALRSERVLDVVEAAYSSASSVATKRGLPRDVAERLDEYRKWCA